MRWMPWIVAMAITLGCGRKDEPGSPPKLSSDAVVAVPSADAASTDFPDVEPTSPPPKPTVKPGKGDCKVEYAPKPTRDPNPMCKVPALKFRMGTDDPDDKFRAERPAFDVELSAYYIDQFEVTTDQIAHYLNAVGDNTCGDGPAGQCFCVKGCWPGDLERSGDRFAIIAGRERVAARHVSLEGARRYCAWLGKQLPTEAQWEAAARFDPATGTVIEYPWGGTYEKNRANEGDKPVQVGAYDGTDGRGDGASPMGIHDLAAGVAERIDGCWTGYPLCSSPPCKDPPPAPIRPGCNGLYRSMGVGPNNTRGTHRSSEMFQGTSGFRCARAGQG